MKNINMCFIYWNKLNYKVYLFFFFLPSKIFQYFTNLHQYCSIIWVFILETSSVHVFHAVVPENMNWSHQLFRYFVIFKVELKFGVFFYMFVCYYQSMFTFKTHNDILCSHVFTCSCIKTLNSLMFCFSSCYHNIVLLYLCS